MSWWNPTSREAQNQYDEAKRQYNNAVSDYNYLQKQRNSEIQKRDSLQAKVNSNKGSLNSLTNDCKKLQDIVEILEKSWGKTVPSRIEDANKAIKNASEAYTFCADSPIPNTLKSKLSYSTTDTAGSAINTALIKYRQALADATTRKDNYKRTQNELESLLKTAKKNIDTYTSRMNTAARKKNDALSTMNHYKKYL